MGKDTPCGECPKPVLMSDNVEVWEIFTHWSSQVKVAGMGEIIGFELPALSALLDMYSVPVAERPFYLDKLSELARVALRYWKTDKETG